MRVRRGFLQMMGWVGCGVIAAAGVTVAAGAGPAHAAPLISCAGSVCTNHGDQPGVGFGNYRCPNGLVYPSFAVVMPHSSALVFPANCGGAPSLY